MTIEALRADPRVTIRRAGPPDPEGRCVVYWMQRAQRGRDNPALDVAIDAANALAPAGRRVSRCSCRSTRTPTAATTGSWPKGSPTSSTTSGSRRVGFVLRRHPEHGLLAFCAEVAPALVIGDENPMREPERGAAWPPIG